MQVTPLCKACSKKKGSPGFRIKFDQPGELTTFMRAFGPESPDRSQPTRALTRTTQPEPDVYRNPPDGYQLAMTRQENPVTSQPVQRGWPAPQTPLRVTTSLEEIDGYKIALQKRAAEEKGR